MPPILQELYAPSIQIQGKNASYDEILPAYWLNSHDVISTRVVIDNDKPRNNNEKKRENLNIEMK